MSVQIDQEKFEISNNLKHYCIYILWDYGVTRIFDME